MPWCYQRQTRCLLAARVEACSEERDWKKGVQRGQEERQRLYAFPCVQPSQNARARYLLSNLILSWCLSGPVVLSALPGSRYDTPKCPFLNLCKQILAPPYRVPLVVAAG